MTTTDPTMLLEKLVPERSGNRKQVYRIGELSREFDVTLRALRFYEDKGLIKPRRQGSTRLYSESDRSRLKVILLARQVGFSLAEIDEIMQIHDNSDRLDDPLGAVLRKFIGQRQALDRQMEEVEEARQRLEAAIASLQEMKRG